MHISEALSIANERRRVSGLPPIVIVGKPDKRSPEYKEIHKIQYASLFERIALSMANDPYAEKRARIVPRV